MSSQIKKFTALENSLNLTKDMAINVHSSASPFDRFDHFTISLLSMARDAPHNGEMHPDGDEAIHVLSGCLEVTLEFEQDQLVKVQAGEGIVIPKGTWHKVHVVEPTQIMTVSPGSRFEFREVSE